MYEESSLGTNEVNNHDIHELVILSDSEPKEELVVGNNPMILASLEIIEVLSKYYTPTT